MRCGMAAAERNRCHRTGDAMTGVVSLANIAGPLRQALAIIDNETWLFEANGDRRRPERNDIAFFFDHGLEVLCIAPASKQAITLDGVLRRLADESVRHDALAAMMVGMDPEVEPDLRSRMLTRAERLLQQTDVHEFVARRLLRSVSTQEWDAQGAARLCTTLALPSAGRLFNILGGTLLSELEDDIYAWATSAGGGTSASAAMLIDKMGETGLIAAAAFASINPTKNGLKQLVFGAKQSGWDPRLVAHLARHAAKEPVRAGKLVDADFEPAGRAEATTRSEKLADASALQTLLPELLRQQRETTHRSRANRRRRMEKGPYTSFVTDTFEATQNQVAWIVNKINDNPASPIWQDIEELCRRQLREATPEHLAKSLTNIAGQIGSAAAKGASVNLRARVVTARILLNLARICAPADPAIRTADAERLRKIRRPDEALAAYDAAVQEFPGNVVARSGRAETLRELGRLDEALAAYDATVQEFPRDVVARNGRASILLDLDRPAEVRHVLGGAAEIPTHKQGWVAAHILCMAELFEDGPTPHMEERLAKLAAACPFPRKSRYFSTALAVIRVALRRPDARAAVDALTSMTRHGDDASSYLLVASAAATAGDVKGARSAIERAGELVPYETFLQRRIRWEIERRYGLNGRQPLRTPEDIRDSDQRLLRFSCGVIVDLARKAA